MILGRNGSVSLTAEERAYRHIIDMIIRGEIRPGDFILEKELATRTGMSRTPVSRALYRLAFEGFVEKLPKKGCFVPTPTPEDASNVFKARIAIETKTAEEAAINATDEEIAELKSIASLNKQAFVTFSKESYSDTNEALHLGIARVARNPYLERWCRFIFWRSSFYILYFDGFYIASEPSEVPPPFSPGQHASVLDAIERRDSEGAGRAMAENVRNTYLQLFRRM